MRLCGGQGCNLKRSLTRVRRDGFCETLFLPLMPLEHSAAASSITIDAVVSRSAAADLILRMISGSIEVRSCFLTPGGGFRPGLPAFFFSAIDPMPVRFAFRGKVSRSAGSGKRPRTRRSHFPHRSADGIGVGLG
jgi:hypothetical protein